AELDGDGRFELISAPDESSILSEMATRLHPAAIWSLDDDRDSGGKPVVRARCAPLLDFERSTSASSIRLIDLDGDHRPTDLVVAYICPPTSSWRACIGIYRGIGAQSSPAFETGWFDGAVPLDTWSPFRTAPVGPDRVALIGIERKMRED